MNYVKIINVCIYAPSSDGPSRRSCTTLRGGQGDNWGSTPRPDKAEEHHQTKEDFKYKKKRTTGWNWTTDIIISSTTGEVFLPRAKVRTPSVNQASYPDLALAGLILRTFEWMGENSERQPFDHVPKMTDGHVDHVINKLQPKNSTHLTCYTARKLTAWKHSQ